MKVIILAGGRGTRLQESAKDIPKALVKIDGKPILQHQIDLFLKHGFSDIRFALGYKSNQIIAYLNGRYEYVVETEPLGTGGALKFASSDLREPFIAVNGDII
ncbi:MAG: NTP transferase domain-containing protein, partial [Candidatus Jacksonbacteria bacterium]|nr:NTP transferase domain-containing protein [Candidatus Jacksonbacteria bacterium]